MTSALVTIARFPYASDAQAACSALHAAGVPAFLESAELAYTAWHIASAADVKLQVSPEDQAAAESILAHTPFLTHPVAGSAKALPELGRHCAECGLAIADDAGSCPACGTAVEILPAEPINLERAVPVLTEVRDDNEPSAKTGVLTWMRRDLRWLVWLMVLPGIAYVALGIVGMLVSIASDVLRPAVDVQIMLLKLLFSLLIVAFLAGLIAGWRRQRT